MSAAACAISCGTIRRGLCGCSASSSYTLLFLPNEAALFSRRSLAVAAVSDPLDVCVKASVTVPNKLGDCPFCHRVLCTMEEKRLPYDMKLVDLGNKPDWFLKISPDGKVPVIKLEELWVPDSDVITQSLEDKFPDPPLGTPLERLHGSKIFATFIGFLKSKDPADGTEQTLIDKGPFINGEKVTAADLSLGSKLYHLEIALGHYEKWSVPETLPFVQSYMKAIFSMDSFSKTRAFPDDVIAGWRPKVTG